MYERPRERDNFEDVGDFHTKFLLPSVTTNGAYPRHPDVEAMIFRVKFMLEEVFEFAQAAGLEIIVPDNEEHAGELRIVQVSENVDHNAMFDALLDEVYVAMGTAHLIGYPWQEGWDRVQRANMLKQRAKSDGSDSKRGSSLDVVKPPGWTPPDHRGTLLRHGWGEAMLYGHSREGHDCYPELCGGSFFDPCTYTPAEIAEFKQKENDE